MNNKVKLVKEKMYGIIKEISKEEYGIEQKELIRILDNANNATILLDDGSADTTNLYTYSETGEKRNYVVSGRLPSCILEINPEKQEDKFIRINPIMHLVDFKNEEVFLSTMYHEICHLSAAGLWIEEDSNKLKHIYGMINKEYVYGKKITENGLVCNNVNEEVNDFVAKKLYEELENREYVANRRPQFDRCQSYIQEQVDAKLSGDFRKFIGYYCSNDIDAMKEVLLTKEIDSFEKLDNYFSLQSYKEDIER